MKAGASVVVQFEVWLGSERKPAEFLRFDGAGAWVRLADETQARKVPRQWVFSAEHLRGVRIYENSFVPKLVFWLRPGATSFGRWIFVREKLWPTQLRHELIHAKQWRETWYVGFATLYFWYFLRHWFRLRDTREAYRAIPFEREAHTNDEIPQYLDTRRRGAWKAYR